MVYSAKQIHCARRLLSVIIAISLTICLCPMEAYAEGGDTDKSLKLIAVNNTDIPVESTRETNATAVLDLIAARPSGASTMHDSRIIQVETGNWHSAAVFEDGTLWMWGRNDYGQLGTGDTYDANIPIKVMDDVRHVSLGGSCSAAVKNDGTLWVWGYNATGLLGTGLTSNVMSPTMVMGDVSEVSLGLQHAAVLKKDGSLWTCGANANGQLGVGDTELRTRFVKAMDNIGSVSVSSTRTAAIDSLGSLWVWGASPIGDGTSGNHTLPTRVAGEVSQVSLDGAYGGSFIKTDGALWAWGHEYVEVGGTFAAKVLPSKIMDDVKNATGDYGDGAALTFDGSLWMWGSNVWGRLGNGTTQGSSEPQKALDNVELVDATGSHIVAVVSDGTLWAWGRNTNGQVGDGSSVDRHRPVAIMRGTAFEKYDIGDSDISIIPTQYWTGQEVKPSPTIAMDGHPLEIGLDYQLGYENNIDEGTATITVTGMGDYRGSKTVNFYIVRRASAARIVSASDAFTQEHLDFINSDTYSGRLDSSWAKTISTGLDTTSGRIGEAMYDVLNDTDSIISGKVSKVSVFNNPYDPIITDLILAQADMKQGDFDLKWENKLVGYVSDLNGICKAIDKDGWSNSEYKTYLEKLIEAPGEYAKENPTFYKLCESIFGNAASSSDFNTLVNAFGKADDLIGAWNAGKNSVEWVAHCLQYNALVSAYLDTSAEFKQSLKDATVYMALNANGDKFISRTQYGLLYEDAYDKFAKFQTRERIENLLLEEYLKDGATRLEDVFGGAIAKNAVSYVAVGLGISEAAAPWVFASIAAYKAGWGISEAITDNGTNIDCRKLARAYYYLEDAMLWEVEDDASNLKNDQSYEKAAKFDASYTILQDLECGALDNYITYLNAQQCSFLQGILHGFRNFNEWEICIAAAMKADWELARCHDESNSVKAASTYGVIKVCCPTDVFVYDKFSNIVFSIEDSKVANRTKGIGGCALGDIKMLLVPDSSGYRISVVATGNGAMSYQASTYNPNGSLAKTATYKDVPLSKGDEFTGIVAGDISLSKEGDPLEQTSSGYDFIAITSVSLDKTNVNLKVGGKSTVKPTITPASASFPEVMWTSSDNNIASVDDAGTITGIAEGNCTVQCSALDNSQEYAVVEVSVSRASNNGDNSSKTDSSIENGSGKSSASSGKSSLKGDGASSKTTGLAKGKTATAGAGFSRASYTVTGATTVTYKAVASKSSKKITVPDTVVINGKAYKVTKVAGKAFNGSKATSITLGANVTTVTAKTFYGAEKVKAITLGKGVRKIAAKSFTTNKALRTIVLKTSKVAKKSAMKNCLKGSKVTKVQVKIGSKAQNKKYVKKYKKLFAVKKPASGKKASVK